MADGDTIFISEETIEPTGSGELDGMTVAVKDNISTAGIRTTCGSAMLRDYIPPYNATVVDRLLAAGATVVGKTNMDEFGMGSTTETSAFGPTKNPVDPDRVPGGSSGGSAAAVAAGSADIALGSDTGGSIRCPAAFCGVVGIKPTYGLVSRYGLVAYANSLEQIGPIAKTVASAARLLDVIAGTDHMDSTTRARSGEERFVDAVDKPVDELTVGIATELIAGADPPVQERFETAMDDLVDQGATITEVSLPAVSYAVPAYYLIAMAEASSNLARFDGVRYGLHSTGNGNWNEQFGEVRRRGFGDEVMRRVLLGTYALSAGYHDRYYVKAQSARVHIQRGFDSVFEQVDVVASPTMPTVPYRLGDSLDDPVQMYLADLNTVVANLANLPAISIPIDPVDGLPVGCQLIGPAFDESVLVRVGSALEQ